MREQGKGGERFAALLRRLCAVPKSEVDKLRAKEVGAKQRRKLEQKTQ